jgi:hypothetical protein
MPAESQDCEANKDSPCWERLCKHAKQWLSTRHVMAATLTYATKNCWKQSFLCSPLWWMSLCNITAARKGLFCVVRPKAISRELKPVVSSW